MDWLKRCEGKQRRCVAEMIIAYLQKHEPVSEKELWSYLHEKIEEERKNDPEKWKGLGFLSDPEIGWWSRVVSEVLGDLRSLRIIGEYDDGIRKIIQRYIKFYNKEKSSKTKKDGYVITKDVFKK